jgi:hypothetical protein
MGAFPFFAVAAAFAILLGNCEPPPGARLGEPFPLEIGGAVRIEEGDLTVKFEEVASDSRCPRDVNCIQAGEAMVQLSITAGDDKAILELAVPPGGSSPAAKFQELLVTVLELEPQPESEKSIDPSSYVAKVKVVRAESGR